MLITSLFAEDKDEEFCGASTTFSARAHCYMWSRKFNAEEKPEKTNTHRHAEAKSPRALSEGRTWRCLRDANAMFDAVYYGKMSKAETERLLERYGREGSFLTRDSESEPGAYCLCVRKSFVVHTFRISRCAGGWAIQTPPGQKPQCFQTLNQLIDYYRKETPGNMVPLLHPLEKQALGWNEDLMYMEI